MAHAALFLVVMLAPLAAGAQTLVIEAADCRRLVEHVPAPDVAYRPGVDVEGRPVAPADLDGGVTLDLPKEYLIDIEVDLAERLGIPRRPGLFDGDVEVGVVAVRGNDVYFNGKLIEESGLAELRRLCREGLAR